MNIIDLVTASTEFAGNVDAIKQSLPDFRWYPYNSLGNIRILDQLLTGENRKLFDQKITPSVLDIGAGDGDIAFLFEYIGCDATILENPSTNYNGGEGFRILKQSLYSRASLIEQDIDFFFQLSQSYDLAIALGILYHLRNPFAFLISLALCCERLLLSTRVAKVMGGALVQDLPLAYLLEKREANSDPTCYWIFSEAGLMRLLRRAGWTVLDKLSVGYQGESSPVDNDKDERIFVYARRVSNFAELLKHHDF
jgi:tRNA (mo5U34)-methyltransferase